MAGPGQGRFGAVAVDQGEVEAPPGPVVEDAAQQLAVRHLGLGGTGGGDLGREVTADRLELVGSEVRRVAVEQPVNGLPLGGGRVRGPPRHADGLAERQPPSPHLAVHGRDQVSGRLDAVVDLAAHRPQQGVLEQGALAGVQQDLLVGPLRGQPVREPTRPSAHPGRR